MKIAPLTMTNNIKLRLSKYIIHYKTFMPYILGIKRVKNIPVIINNRNRLACLKELIRWLERAGLNNIYIIDNASTYPPLLDFYKQTNYNVIRLNDNIGYLALWKIDIFSKFKNDFYIYSDPDVVPVNYCPLNATKYFFKLLWRFVDIEKVGFGLKIDDLPDCYKLKADVIEHERQFWLKEKEISPNVFHVPIDTTFAMYKPKAQGGDRVNSLRTGEPFIAQHLPWYSDSENQTEEELFYKASINNESSYWSVK